MFYTIFYVLFIILNTNIKFDDSPPEAYRPGKCSPKSKCSPGINSKKIYTKSQSLFFKQTHLRDCLDLQKQNHSPQERKHWWIKRKHRRGTEPDKLEVNMDLIIFVFVYGAFGVICSFVPSPLSLRTSKILFKFSYFTNSYIS